MPANDRACPKPILSKYQAIQPALSSKMKRAFVSFLLKGPLIVSMVTVLVQCEPPSAPQAFLLKRRGFGGDRGKSGGSPATGLDAEALGVIRSKPSDAPVQGHQSGNCLMR